MSGVGGAPTLQVLIATMWVLVLARHEKSTKMAQPPIQCNSY